MRKKAAESDVKEPVKIRLKELKSGNKSIYLDCYVNGVREYKFLNLYLRPEVTIFQELERAFTEYEDDKLERSQNLR